MVLPLWPAARPFLKFPVMGYPLEEIIKWAFTTPIQFWIGWRFHAGAYHALRNGRCAAASPACPLSFLDVLRLRVLRATVLGTCGPAMAFLGFCGPEEVALASPHAQRPSHTKLPWLCPTRRAGDWNARRGRGVERDSLRRVQEE